ncbi:hypothetical protein ACFV5M_09495 [Streptomyces albidoflavus]
MTTPGDQVTATGHVQYGDLLLGRGTVYRWRSLTGWEDLPPLDSGSAARSGAHGSIPGRLLAQSRTITLDDIRIRARAGDIGAAVHRFSAGTGLSDAEMPLVVQLDERGPLLSWARVTARVLPVERGYTLGAVSGAALQFTASDPRRYELIERSASTGLPLPEPGLRWGGGDPQQHLDPEQAAGTGPESAWTATGAVLGTTDGAVTVTITDASPTAPAYVMWSRAAGDPAPFPVPAGAGSVSFAADALPAGARVQLNWFTADGAYLSTDDDAQVVTAPVPPDAAGVTPLLYWTAVPSPATVPLGPSRLLIPGLNGEGLTWPLDFGTPGSTGVAATDNVGTAPTHPTVEFRGPVSMPSVTNLVTGDVLEYDVDLADGDALVVTTATGDVTLNGTASRLYTATARSVPEQTWALAPGAADVAFRASPDSLAPAASATLRWRSAFW